MARLACFLFGHRWRSTFVGRLLPTPGRFEPGHIYEGEVWINGRDLYTNCCERCDATTGPTVPLEPER